MITEEIERIYQEARNRLDNLYFIEYPKNKNRKFWANLESLNHEYTEKIREKLDLILLPLKFITMKLNDRDNQSGNDVLYSYKGSDEININLNCYPPFLKLSVYKFEGNKSIELDPITTLKNLESKLEVENESR